MHTTSNQLNGTTQFDLNQAVLPLVLLPTTPSAILYQNSSMITNESTSCILSVESLIPDRPGATIISPICLAFTGIVGQIAALVYLYRGQKVGNGDGRQNHSRTVFYLLLTTLIWTDLIGKVVVTPPALVSYAHGSWVGGDKLCNLHGFSMSTMGLVTHFLVALMAVDRFLCVRLGFFYKAMVTKSKTRLILMGIWLFSILFSLLPLFGVGEYEIQYPGTWCFINIHITSATPWYIQLFTDLYGVMNVLCVTVIVICNFVVIGSLIRKRMVRNRNLSAFSVPFPNGRGGRQRDLETQMVIVLMVITVVFLVSWLPLDLRIFLNQIFPHKCMNDHLMDLIAIRMASLNQILDPWVYIISRKVFRSKLWSRCCTFHLKRSQSCLGHNKGSVSVTKLNLDALDYEEERLIESRRRQEFISERGLTKLPNKEYERLCQDLLIIGHEELMPLRNEENSSWDSGMASPHDASIHSIQPPLPIFNTKLTRIDEILAAEFHFSQLECSRKAKRLLSSNSDKTYISSRKPDLLTEESLSTNSLREGRRHSWSCSPSVYKHFTSQSTQTSEDDDMG